MNRVQHESTGYVLGGPPTFYHHATCSCTWAGRGRGHVETARRDFEEHRIATSLPKVTEGTCSWCDRKSPRCFEFFSGLSFARLCPDCIKHMHHSNIEAAKAERHVRYAERAGYGR
jgi:hypothetical protein